MYLLLNQINNVGALDEKKLLNYLQLAIHTNQPNMVTLLITQIKTTISKDRQTQLFKSISMSVSSVAKTDISILRQLKDHGVSFSAPANAIINQKENRPIGYLLPMGIMLYKFTDFVKELSLQLLEVGIYQFNYMKQKFTKLKDNPSELINTQETKDTPK